ncbi:hypothetical protein [[Muricauda] lutisoli]|uniref:Uncharacterized protein n=1 Tax=[Muricauda] lutisoli TaxID=2816035 RepID=A0ABS3EXY8_9FLAO|nr:hypothetical protein [[Muricauda] lutisoli]MBO0331124.1 hypothetical protein [[Muricauda] lutisoli]
MIQPFKLADQIQKSEDFKILLLANYMEHSNGVSMQQYAKSEKQLLSLGTYGVEDFQNSVSSYIDFLGGIID